MIKPYEERFPWMLDWNLLRTFMVLVDRQGITRAAEYLGVTQPTISSALKRLEETVGKRLVDRSPGHFRVTEAGEILHRECSTVFGSVSQLPRLMAQADDRVTGHLTIVMTSHVVCPHLDEHLSVFNRRHPDATYAISVAESPEVISRLKQNRASLGVCLMRDPDPELDVHLLFRECFGLFCGPNHRLFGRTDLELADLVGEPSVSFQTDTESGPLSSVTQLRDRALLKPGLKGISANLPEVRRMIFAGLGIGALPLHVARRDVDSGMLWQLPPYTDLPVVDVFLVTNPRRSLNPAEKLFLKGLKTLIAETPLSQRTYE